MFQIVNKLLTKKASNLLANLGTLTNWLRKISHNDTLSGI